jgi:hypothetical protein
LSRYLSPSLFLSLFWSLPSLHACICA